MEARTKDLRAGKKGGRDGSRKRRRERGRKGTVQ